MSDISKNSIRVAAICGSLRPASYTRSALEIALAGARELGAETELIDLRSYQLPFCDGEDARQAPDVLRLKREIKGAHGVLLGTPEYHAGFSGVLKNALDLMGFDEFEGKMIGLLGVAGGSMGATNSLNSLRAVGRSLRAWVLPQQVSIAQGWKQFDNDGNLKDPQLEQRVQDMGRQVARFAYLLTSDQAMAFLQAWEEAPLNPGGEWD
ncbi:MAG: NADPH-dependent FMN reductase [Chloroflexota bacterium]|nr:NADPH-dependent FMN reductase [Chloroflexota bacterium]